jgi:hypothetical protein
MCRTADQRRQWGVQDAPVEEEVDTHDGRVTECGNGLVEQARALYGRHGHDEGIRLDGLAVREPGTRTFERSHPGADPDRRAARTKGISCRLAVHRPKGSDGENEVACLAHAEERGLHGEDRE